MLDFPFYQQAGFWLYSASFFCVFFGISGILGDLKRGLESLRGTEIERRDQQSILILHELKQILECGEVISSFELECKTQPLAPDIRFLFLTYFKMFRDRGLPGIPLIVLFQSALRLRTERRREARIASAQAWGQMSLGFFIVPLFAGVIQWVVPEIENHRQTYLSSLVVSAFFLVLSVLWMKSLCDRAARAYAHPLVHQDADTGFLVIQALIAEVQAGTPVDLAWRQSLRIGEFRHDSVRKYWTDGLWTIPTTENSSCRVTDLLCRTAIELRRTLQVCLIEGRSALDRIHSVSDSFNHERDALVQGELKKLGSRAILPLFVGLAPALFIQIVFVVYVIMANSVGSGLE